MINNNIEMYKIKTMEYLADSIDYCVDYWILSGLILIPSIKTLISF